MSDTPLEPSEFKRGPGGRPTREEAERRHRLLLATAFRLFLDRGWDGVSVEEISRQSGVAKGFIYARYADKDALFTEAIERLMADVMGTLHLAEPPPDDVEEGLVALVRRDVFEDEVPDIDPARPRPANEPTPRPGGRRGA